MSDPDDLDRAVVAGLRAHLAGDGEGLHAVLATADLGELVEWLLCWTNAYGSRQEGSIAAWDSLLAAYQDAATGR